MREEELKPTECPRCETKNPAGAKYCYTCSMVLDHKLDVEVQDLRTETFGQANKVGLDNGDAMQRILDFIEKVSEKTLT